MPEKEKTDGLAAEPQPGIGSREDLLVGAVFVPGGKADRCRAVCAVCVHRV